MSRPSRPNRLTRSSLIRGLRSGSPSAWNDFVALFSGLVVSQIRRAGVAASDEADVGQEVFAGIVAGIERYRHDPDRAGSFRAWIAGITRHKIADHYESRRRRPVVDLDAIEAAAAEEDAADEDADDGTDGSDDPIAALGEIAGVIESVRRDFQPQTWEVFWRVAMHDQRPAEVARELGITAVAARQAKYRVTMRMRDEFDRLADLEQSD